MAALALALALILAAACGAPQERGGPGNGPLAASDSPALAPDASPIAADGGADAADATAAGAPEGNPGAMRTRGITGSFNRGDVNQTMETREDALMRCVEQRPSYLRWVSGRIDFHVEVGGDGQITQVRTVASTIGYRKLELCLTEVLAQTVMPPPDGRDDTCFDWGMKVEPATVREPDPIDASELADTLERYSGNTYKTCSTLRRARFKVTAYLGTRGKILAAGAVPVGSASTKSLDCLLEEMKGWKIPRVKRRSKVEFTLRWRPPPPTRRARKAKHRRPKISRRKRR